MAGKLLVEVHKPETQSIESGKALAKYLGLKEEMPEKIPLANGAQLTLSSKKDAYYYTSLNGCSCPAGENHRICWHRRDLTQAIREATKAPKKTLLQEMADEGYDMSFEPDPKYDSRTKVNDDLQLFGHSPFKPCLE